MSPSHYAEGKPWADYIQLPSGQTAAYLDLAERMKSHVSPYIRNRRPNADFRKAEAFHRKNLTEQLGDAVVAAAFSSAEAMLRRQLVHTYGETIGQCSILWIKPRPDGWFDFSVNAPEVLDDSTEAFLTDIRKPQKSSPD